MTAGKTVDKCEGLRVEHAFSHRYQCLKTKARAIFIINHKHPYYRAWRRGLICSFSPLSVSLPPLISLLLREQADGTSRSVDRHGAGWQSRGLSTPQYVWVTQIRLRPVSAWPESLFKGLFRVHSWELLLHFQSVAANIRGVSYCAFLCPLPGFKNR